MKDLIREFKTTLVPSFKKKKENGFSLVEVIFAVTIFVTISFSIYQGISSLTALISASRDKIVAIDLVNGEFELIRNLAYVDVGLTNGIPQGVLNATTTKIIDGREFAVVRVVRNIDDPFDGQIGEEPNDLSPADYKLVEIEVTCLNCKHLLSFSSVAHIAPKNLETASTNGALFVRVLDANGQPVPQAEVEITNSGSSVYIEETTDNSGNLQIVDAPPGENAYRIIVTKSGYTTDRTYASTPENPNPVKPDATVLLQQVTQISFIIDKVSTINVFSKNLQCGAVAGVSFNIAGAKLIGTDPNVLKFSANLDTGSGGVKTLNGVEWDSFTISPGGSFNLIGVNPPSPFAVLPDSVKNVDIIVGGGVPNNLLVTVKDSNGLPLSEVTLTLSQGSFNVVKITGRGYFSQSDWSGGPGQQNFGDPIRYFTDDGNIDIDSPVGELKLVKILSDYAPSGILTSSIFDTGTSTNFSSVIWSPTDQPPQTGPDSVKAQIATSPDNTATTTWQYLGPDATASTFYTLSNANISNIHNGDRYLRYKVFLSTAASNKTPNIADLAITYTSDCVPSGQALFESLSSGNHDLLLEKTGYQSQMFPVNIITNDDWQSVEAVMLPE